MGLLTRISCFLLVIKCVCSLQFYLNEGQSLCFGENIAPNAKVLGEYTVAAGTGHMPVDIIVRDLAENKTLYERSDINHGKFAFIAPFGEELPHIHSAELNRKDHDGHHHDHDHDHEYDHHHGHHVHDEDHHNHDSPPEHDHGHDWDHNHHEGHHAEGVHHRQTRGLLSFDEHEHDHAHGYRAPPEAHNPHAHDFETHHERGGGEHPHGHEHDYNDNPHHHESHYNDHASRDYHQHYDEHDKKLDHMDAHDGEHGNMEEDWDLDKYDGIHDEDLEKEWNENENKHPGHDHDDDIDEDDFTRDAALFKERKFEICLISRSANNQGLKRRVRLHLRHGKAAHDYTRLAKKEHLSSLELTLRIVSDELKELHTELDHARQLEDSLRIMNEKTSRRVVHYATFSMIVLVGVSMFQAMYTKRFFKTKKLL